MFAVWAQADTPDAGPALRRLSVRLLVRNHTGGAIGVQQGARVAVDVDDFPKILPSCRTSTWDSQKVKTVEIGGPQSKVDHN